METEPESPFESPSFEFVEKSTRNAACLCECGCDLSSCVIFNDMLFAGCFIRCCHMVFIIINLLQKNKVESYVD